MPVRELHVFQNYITSKLELSYKQHKQVLAFKLFTFSPDCPKLENTVPHLHVSTVDVRPGAQVQLSCDPGFYLVGEPVLQCQNRGEWSHNLPSCERKTKTGSAQSCVSMVLHLF